MGGGFSRGGGGHRASFRGAPTRERSSFKHLGHLKKLLPYCKRYAWVLVFSISGLLLQRFGMAWLPQFMKIAIDSLSDPQIPPNIVLPALGILGVTALNFLIYVWARRALRRVSIAVTYDLRKRIFGNTQIQGPGFFNKFSTGDLMSRAVNDVSQVRMSVSFGWVTVVMFFFTITMGLWFMFSMSPGLAIVTILPLPFVALVGFFMSRSMYPYFIERQEAMARVTSFAQENLNGIRTIQAMSQEASEIERFRDASTQYIKKAYRATRFMQFMGISMSGLTMISPLIILGYGGSMVLEGNLSLGTWTAFSVYLVMVTSSVTQIGWSLSMFTSAAAGTERIFEIIDHEPEVKDDSGSVIDEDFPAHIEIKALTYTYPEASTPSLNNIDLNVEPGKTIALLGRMGSGKSTVLKSIVRLNDVAPNTIFLGGHDICDFPIKKLREQIALVPQYAFLFSATIKENITYDDPERKDEAVWDAIDAAGLSDTVSEFVDGIDTIVGERGVTLSGGQKQRATLARGLIRDSKVLLLDDVFSSVDTETEERIISGLNRLRADKTTILISHRVSTARHADYIYVFDNGRILEQGTHDELLSTGGYYADLEGVQSNQDEDQTRRERLIRTLTEHRDDSDDDVSSVVAS